MTTAEILPSLRSRSIFETQEKELPLGKVIPLKPGEQSPVFYIESDTEIKPVLIEGWWAVIAQDPIGNIHQYFYDPGRNPNQDISFNQGWTYTLLMHRKSSPGLIIFSEEGNEPLQVATVDNLGILPNGQLLTPEFRQVISHINDKKGKYE